MKYYLSMGCLIAVAFLSQGCGGGDSDEAALEDPIEVSSDEVGGSTKAGKTRKSKAGSTSLVAVDQALQNGEYGVAVETMYKNSGNMTQEEMMLMQRDVQSAIANAMARGDAKALKASQDMQKVMQMQMQQRRR